MVEKIDSGDQAEEMRTVDDDGDKALVELGQQRLNRLVGLDCLDVGHHRGADRVVKAEAVLEHRQQQVGFVDEADDAIAFQHRQLRAS